MDSTRALRFDDLEKVQQVWTKELYLNTDHQPSEMNEQDWQAGSAVPAAGATLPPEPSELLPELALDGMLDYSDIDAMLTQELRDLDIPMLGEFDPAGPAGGSQHASGTPGGRPPSAFSHKRGPSGTAIFGFLSHNKHLSISSRTQADHECGRGGLSPLFTPEMMATDDKGRSPHYMYREPEKPAHLSQALLKQQEEIRVALERQKEVNKKLEMQLRENKLQQEQLQKVLQDQEYFTQQLSRQQMHTGSTISNDKGTPPRIAMPDTTPSKSTTTPRAHPESIIITHNSASKGYQFPPPLMISPPSSHPTTSMTGSPQRRHRRASWLTNDSGKQGGQVSELESITDFLTNLDKYESKDTLSIHDDPHKNDSHAKSPFLLPTRGASSEMSNRTPFTPKEQLFSLSPSHAQYQHAKKESVLSTVSTIPQQSEDLDNSPKNHSPLRYAAHDPSLHGLRIPPGGCRPKDDANCGAGTSTSENQGVGVMKPRIYNFQHTPVKQKTLNDAVSLRPKETESSPMKITRKPTTLPRGTIDQYVHELPDKLFECAYPECGKIFKRRYNVRSHIQTHLEDRPYVCDFPGCHKAFVRNHDLARHKKAHYAKVWTCSCGRRFQQEKTLESHKSRMTCTPLQSVSQGPTSVSNGPTSAALSAPVSPRKSHMVTKPTTPASSPRKQMAPLYNDNII